ncbi:hypothetical protein GJ496_000735 [Pomphorhynchus laevis]|nr:hypothetical protein GJ496_000735 [Pomphorhynchus laevis]
MSNFVFSKYREILKELAIAIVYCKENIYSTDIEIKELVSGVTAIYCPIELNYCCEPNVSNLLWQDSVTSLNGVLYEVERDHSVRRWFSHLWYNAPCVSKTSSNLSNYNAYLLGKSYYSDDQYKAALQRIDNGVAMVDQLADMIADRCALEQEYAYRLVNWSDMWKSKWAQSPDYGSNKATMFAVLNAATEESHARMQIADDLKNSLVDYIKEWRTRLYTSSKVEKIRNFCRQRFERETAIWQKFAKKIESTKLVFHDACMKLKNGEAFKHIIESDSGTTDETKNKFRHQVQELSDRCAKLREDYKNALAEINDRKQLYVQNMNDIFQRCEELENERLKLFKEVFEKYIDVILPTNSSANNIKLRLQKAVDSHSAEADLTWWSDTYGPGTVSSTNWPRFEDMSIY